MCSPALLRPRRRTHALRLACCMGSPRCLPHAHELIGVVGWTSDRAPGPGEYALGTTTGYAKPPVYKSAPSTGFGTSSRLPGDAPVPKRLDRTTIERLNATGASEVLGGESKPLVKDAELMATPGPGSYDEHSWRKKREPAFSFGTSSQRPAASTRASRVPGPGKYRPAQTLGQSTALTMAKGPAVGFGTAKIGGGIAPIGSEGMGASALRPSVRVRSMSAAKSAANGQPLPSARQPVTLDPKSLVPNERTTASHGAPCTSCEKAWLPQ